MCNQYYSHPAASGTEGQAVNRRGQAAPEALGQCSFSPHIVLPTLCPCVVESLKNAHDLQCGYSSPLFCSAPTYELLYINISCI